jgi:hypothetical protein
LVISKFPWLVSSGYILPEYPASVVVGKLTYGFSGYYPTHILDCIANDDPTSKECSFTRKHIAFGTKIREAYNLDISTFKATYIYVCPSCVVAHDELSGSETKILNAFTQWFLTLDKPQRRELMSLLGDEENASVRWSLKQESDEAVKEYLEARTRVEQQERERRRRELLGQ